ncbi:MAG: hypothetical protein BWY21_01562 [Parcubacteria group bacterium ADurb.Bin216]|nr:MAG: hypothetical protein BWY21_01562 [Parcubacteria group bacterium ADurb.Bin216]
METQLIEIFKILGVASVAFIIWLIIKEIGTILKNKDGSPNDIQQRVADLEKSVNNDYKHEYENIWEEIRLLRKNNERLEEKLNNLNVRISKLEK